MIDGKRFEKLEAMVRLLVESRIVALQQDAARLRAAETTLEQLAPDDPNREVMEPVMRANRPFVDAIETIIAGMRQVLEPEE